MGKTGESGAQCAKYGELEQDRGQRRKILASAAYNHKLPITYFFLLENVIQMDRTGGICPPSGDDFKRTMRPRSMHVRRK
jgi:hypothetical protein